MARIYYSVGGGFVVNENKTDGPVITESKKELPFPFESGEELLSICATQKASISELMLQNEKVWRDESEIRRMMIEIWDAMQACVTRGCNSEGLMPGLKVKRRAARMHQQLVGQAEAALRDPLTIMDWVNLYALAVNEENAVGGRMVTAPTNGAAGIIPAVLHYYKRFCSSASEDGVVRFLLTAGAIGLLFKRNASISGAEVCFRERGWHQTFSPIVVSVFGFGVSMMTTPPCEPRRQTGLKCRFPLILSLARSVWPQHMAKCALI